MSPALAEWVYFFPTMAQASSVRLAPCRDAGCVSSCWMIEIDPQLAHDGPLCPVVHAVRRERQLDRHRHGRPALLHRDRLRASGYRRILVTPILGSLSI